MPCRPAIASMSLGRAWVHGDLHHKLQVASQAGFQGVEIFYEDLEYLAKSHENNGEAKSPGEDSLLHAAQLTRQWCDELQLPVFVLQPFAHYEGLKDRDEHAERIEKLRLWFRLATALGTDLIQIPSNFLPEDQITDDMDVIVKDLQQAADLGAQQTPPFRFAYESIAWATHVDTWEQAWEVVRRVDRPNFGICLDTFNICGRVWADPAAEGGRIEGADEILAKSVARMVDTVDVRKVYYVQVVDAERLESPLVTGHAFFDAEQPARMSWSRNARLFAYEEGGYLPILKVVKAIVEGLKFEGWVSMELFSRTLAEEGKGVPEEHARRGIESWRKLNEEFGLA